MKSNQCVIGGEGNGGVIYPALHYGRDALVGIALFLTHLASSGLKCSELRKKYPEYVISKNKISLGDGINVDQVLSNVKNHYSGHILNETDGLKIDFPDSWVHLADQILNLSSGFMQSMPTEIRQINWRMRS